MIRTAKAIATPPMIFNANPARNLWRTTSEPAKVITSPATIRTNPLSKINTAPTMENAKPKIARCCLLSAGGGFGCCKTRFSLKQGSYGGNIRFIPNLLRVKRANVDPSLKLIERTYNGRWIMAFSLTFTFFGAPVRGCKAG